jgi:hypothetical protein
MISPSSVMGDQVVVTITGATANSLVTLTYSYNGASNAVWNAGYTDGSGNWSVTGYSPSYQIGTWNEQWAVGGVDIGPSYFFEIFDQPSSLTVLTTGGSSPSRCTAPTTYGPSGSWQYQINGSYGSEIVPSPTLGIVMIPTESVDIYNPFTGAYVTNISGNVGGDPPFPWSPPSATNASSSGRFYDVPYSVCTAMPFATVRFASQTIYVAIGGQSYAVRLQDFYGSSASSGHGTEYNSVGDISYAQ